MPQLAYNPNPRSYQHLLAAGIPLWQIREAINSGLNPAQLPPEYFGMSGGYSPQSVGPGAAPTPSGIGGIDIPPANMNDPYGYTFSNPQPNVGGTDIGNWMGNTPAGGLGFQQTNSIPPSVYPNTGGQMQLGGYGGGQIPIQPMDWGYVPSSQQYGWTMPDYSSMSSGGQMDLGGYGGSGSTGMNLYGNPIDWGYLPSSDTYGWSTPDYGSYSGDSSGAGFAGSGALSYSEPTPIPYSDPGSLSSGGEMTLGGYGGVDFQAPDAATAGVFSPLPTDYSSLGMPGADSIPVPEGFGQLTQPQAIPDVGAYDTQAPTEDQFGSSLIPSGGITAAAGGYTGGFGVGAGPGYGVTGAGFSTGYTPFGGGGVGPQFSGGSSGMGIGANAYGGYQNSSQVGFSMHPSEGDIYTGTGGESVAGFETGLSDAWQGYNYTLPQIQAYLDAKRSGDPSQINAALQAMGYLQPGETMSGPLPSLISRQGPAGGRAGSSKHV